MSAYPQIKSESLTERNKKQICQKQLLFSANIFETEQSLTNFNTSQKKLLGVEIKGNLSFNDNFSLSVKKIKQGCTIYDNLSLSVKKIKQSSAI